MAKILRHALFTFGFITGLANTCQHLYGEGY
jgi:hypothetical protein